MIGLKIHLSYDVPDVLVVLEGDLASGLQGESLSVLSDLTIGSVGEAGKGIALSGMELNGKGLSSDRVVVKDSVRV